MKNITLKYGIIMMAILFTGFSVSAQEEKKEESKMVVKVVKEGKTVLDTTYNMDEDFDKEKIETMIEKLEGEKLLWKILKRY